MTYIIIVALDVHLQHMRPELLDHTFLTLLAPLLALCVGIAGGASLVVEGVGPIL